MANILEVIINGDAKGLNQSLSSASSKLKAFGKQTTDIGKRLSTRLTLPIGLAGAAAVKSASDFEKLQTSLNVLTGGAEQGAKAFERLVKFSAKTPFQLGDLAKVNNQLIGFGMSTDDAFDSLKLLGDVSAVAGADLTSVAVAFGQSAAAGRVMQQDINQFINNGIPIYKILNGVTGASVDQLRKMGSEGKITFDLLKKGFIKATSEGGQFENGMQKLSQTFAGQFSTLKDNLNIALAKFGKILLPILKDSMASFTSLIQTFSNLDKGTQRMILTIAGLAAVLPPLLIVIGSLASALGALTLASGVVGVAIVALTAIVANVVVYQSLKNEIQNIIKILPNLKKGVDDAKESFDGSATSSLNLFKAQRKLIKSELELLKLQQDKEQGSIAKILGIESKEYKELGKKIKQTEVKIKNYDLSIQGLESSLKDLGDSSEDLQKKLGVPFKISDFEFGNEFEEAFLKAQQKAADKAEIEDIRVGMGIDGAQKGLFDLASIQGASKALDDLEDMQAMEDLDSFLTQMDPKLKSFNDQLKATKEIGLMVSETLKGAMVNAFVSMGEAIGQTMSGISGAGQNFTKSLLSTIGTMATQLGKLAISVGIGIKGIKAALKSLNPAVAIAAGVALVALGSFVSNRASEIGSGGVTAFANGGIVSSPTLGLMGEYPGARSNPEVIAPLDKLKSMIGGGQTNVNITGGFKLEGQDLVLALQRADRNRTRIL